MQNMYLGVVEATITPFNKTLSQLILFNYFYFRKYKAKFIIIDFCDLD